MPNFQRTVSFLYRLSPRELILINGSIPLFPQRFIVNGDTRNTSATSRTVMRSGRLLREMSLLLADDC